MVDYAAEFSASLDASGSPGSMAEAAGSAALAVGVEAAQKTTEGAQVKEYAEAALAGAAAGAAAGSLCGPAAPICSVVGAIAGCLIALGSKIAEAFSNVTQTEPCRVWDYEFVNRRCPVIRKITNAGSAPGDWQVGPYGLEKMLWGVRTTNWPPGMTLGFVFWCLRRIREDGLGLEYYAKLANALEVPDTSKGRPALFSGKLPPDEILKANSRALENSTLGTMLKERFGTSNRFFYAATVARAGGSIYQIRKASGSQPTWGEIQRYKRTKALLDAEFKNRAVKAPSVESPAVGLLRAAKEHWPVTLAAGGLAALFIGAKR